MRGYVKVLGFFLLLIVSVISLLEAQWTAGGIGVCTAVNDQTEPLIISDGSGGSIIAWDDDRVDHHIYAQRLNKYGEFQWGTDGEGVSDTHSLINSIVPDDSGGAIIAFSVGTLPEWDIYAQRIDPDGDTLWGGHGIPVCTTSSLQAEPCALEDGFGGAFIAWFEGFDDDDIRAQRITSAGARLWDPEGILICDETVSSEYNTMLVPDGAEGAIIAWVDNRGGSQASIYAQRVDPTGDTLWVENGICIVDGSAFADYTPELSPYSVPDGEGGVITTWVDWRGSAFNIYAQKIDSTGNAVWTEDGIHINTDVTSWYTFPRLIPDGSGGAILAYFKIPSSADKTIRVQRIDDSGNRIWGDNGIEVNNLGSVSIDRLQIVPDAGGGAVIVFGYTDGIFAQRVDSSGIVQWDPEGIEITSSTTYESIRMMPNGISGVVVAWEDELAGDLDIYAQRIELNGYLGYYPMPVIESVQDVPNDQGGKIQLRWARSYLDTIPNTEITHYSVWRRLPPLAEGMLYASDEQTEQPKITADFEGHAVRMLSDGYAWEWLENVPARYFETYALTVESLYDSLDSDPGWQYFMVSAQTETAYVYYDSPIDSGYSVDNLAPAVPLGFAVAYNAGGGNQLTWNECEDEDFCNFRIYRSETEDFVPSPENLVHITIESSWLDTVEEGWMYHYKIAAVDHTGNESTAASPGQVTGDDLPAIPGSYALYQNAPNPFNPTTVIRFDLPEDAEVRLCIFNVKGELIAKIVDRRMKRGSKEVTWDARDKHGRKVSSGIYFYRLTAGDFRQTRKMALMR